MWLSSSHARSAAPSATINSSSSVPVTHRRLVAAHAWWDRQGRPDFERFGLTVSRQGQRAWLDSPDNSVPLVR
ncbi:hypothetical protein GCM10010342_14610 [Streptomyces anulatus]|nr:hypothetical protein GCM10010342_14610 [Streptomyces anulatus]